MDNLIEKISNILAAIGALTCLLAGVGRIFGFYYLLGFQTITLFIGGIALLVMACFLKLHRLTAHTHP